MKKQIPTCGPCSHRVNGEIVEAPFCVIGLDPNRSGGGVLHWAWSPEEASYAAAAYRDHGYHEVKVRNALSKETQNEVHEIIFGIMRKSNDPS